MQRFNDCTIFYDFTEKEMLIDRRQPRFYTEEEVKEAVENPTIIHFSTSFLSKRAWMNGCKHRYVDEWLKYKSMSPWKDGELWDDNRPIWKQNGVKVLMKMPIGIAVRIAGLMQVYGRPLKNRLRK